ncbi:phosphoribosyl-AMP cyclohydrolase [Pusillimonas minor]|uniref:Phosphoribosyl-AMP cyclohydrolase n=1 Tax=Pusillimonas minor TaxID=2697024 RepID=A0A842HNZ8_9BURK|nr:phosphoribosyl-AMP cyclohydrolase [Pusillimonas minor]MBC2770639.1 phosphoribosyl-AMP cyclohydrolase [Pusillimonas minor]
MNSWISDVKFDEKGLIPAIAQDADTGVILMVAWMNAESLAETVRTGRAVYWSRSRGRLWRKGEASGHVQHLREIRLDCDADVLLLKVKQDGGIACHTGRESCFYRRLDDNQGQAIGVGNVLSAPAAAAGQRAAPNSAPNDAVWNSIEPVLKDPEHIYK